MYMQLYEYINKIQVFPSDIDFNIKPGIRPARGIGHLPDG